MNRTLVSILTPSFNQARWLRDNIASVEAQTYPNIEHVIADGGSSDGSVELLRAAPAVRWLSEPDEGQADALNKAFVLSSGEIIGWLNSDDGYFSTTAVEEVVDLFEAHPDVDIVYGHAVVVDADGRLRYVKWVPRIDYRLILLGDWLVQPAVFIRRRALGDRMADSSFHSTMDRELWLRIGKEAKLLRHGAVLAVDRNHPDRKSLDFVQMHSDMERAAELYNAPRGVGPSIVRRFRTFWYMLRGLSVLRQLRGASALPTTAPSTIVLGLRQILEAFRFLVPLPWRSIAPR